MNTIGERLKQARLDQNYSLADMQAQTKIQVKYLEAIENHKLDALPGEFYYQTFVKQYADALGLDGEALLEGTSSVSSEDILNDQVNEPDASQSGQVEGSQSEPSQTESSQSAAASAVPDRQPDPFPAYAAQEVEGRDGGEAGEAEGDGQEPAPYIPQVERTSVSFDDPIGFGMDEEPASDEGPQPSAEATYTQSGVSIEYPEEETMSQPLTATAPPPRQAEEDDPNLTRRPQGQEEEVNARRSSSCFERYGCGLLIILLVIVAAALFYFFISQDSANDTSHLDLNSDSEQVEDSPESAEESTEPAGNEEEAETPPPTADIQQVEADGTNGLYAMDSQGADQIIVEVAATTEEAWVGVSADGELYRQGILNQNEVMEISLDGSVSSIEFAVGNAPATEIRINGTVIDFPAENEGNPTQYLTIDVN